MNFFRRSSPTVTNKDDDASSHEDSHDESSHGSEETDDEVDDEEEDDNEREEEAHENDAAMAEPAPDDDLQRTEEVVRRNSLEVAVRAEEDAIASVSDEKVDFTCSESAVALESKNATHATNETEEQSQHDDRHDDEDSSGLETDDESSLESEKKGWFSFLRRNKHREFTDEDSDTTDDEHERDEDVHQQALETQPETNQQQQQQQQKSLLEETAGEDEIAQAIQRVQQRITDYRRKQEANSSGAVTNDFREAYFDEPVEQKTVEGTDETEAQNGNDLIILQDVSSEAIVSTQSGHEEGISTESSAETPTTRDSAVDNEIHSTEITNGEGTKNQIEGERVKEEQLDHDAQEQHHDDGDDDAPTLQERRSLLSLAAEHNRVDVIKELVSMTTSDSDRTSLLRGLGGHTQRDDNDPKDDGFVPPPLHAAVAHGSIDAASCLLRMGADPSLRPLLPALDGTNAKLHRANSNTEQDRNYKKYHGKTAWELAFGALIKVEDEYDVEKDESERTTNRGWFGFGAKEEGIKPEACTKQDGSRYKKISGLNIPANKLDGIRHAFTAEALRAIGSDEVHRLSQLLEAGMSPEIEVAGKTLKKWAGEMDAVGCLALMMRGGSEDVKDGEEEVGDGGEEDRIVEQEDMEPLVEFALDECLAGLSHSDIATLIQESESLIPALTSCRDDLAEEMDMCQNMLRDINATGGRGGLSSHSLLDLVRSLKDERQELEETFKQWQEAWEEREDELDFFWEEAIEEDMREEFLRSGVLDRVTEPTPVGVKPISPDLTLQELAHRYYEADNRVSTLRSSIASLAEESGRYRDEIEKSGMSGALSLVKSLRSEVKELKEKISQAQAGELTCRGKIELIQRRIGHPVNENVEEVEDVQLKAIVEEQNDGDRGQSPRLQQPTLESSLCRVPTSEVFSSQPNIFQRGGIGQGAEEDEGQGETDGGADHILSCESDEEIENDKEQIDAADVAGKFSCNGVSRGDDNPTFEAKASKTPIHVDRADTVGDKPVPQHAAIATKCEPEFMQASKPGRESDDTTRKPSLMSESGMSTAIVVRQPNGKANSLSLQIWDLLRRIVGLSRSSSSFSYGYHEYDVTSSSHIMIV
ncbi:hypothetical protein ACHAW6_014398 [Cyclotella cf. meneghiniana]